MLISYRYYYHDDYYYYYYYEGRGEKEIREEERGDC